MNASVPASSTSRSTRAFTIIELLVVIGIIAVIAGITAFSLGGSTGGGIAVQTAQGNILSMVSAVRSTAALQNQKAALFVNADPDSEGFLRELQVAYDTTGAGNWRARGASTFLPGGVFIVPDPASASADTFKMGSAATDNVELVGTWNTASWELYSAAMPPAADKVKLLDENNGELDPVYLRLCELPSVGKAEPGNVGKITVAAAKRVSASRMVFDNPSSVRGVNVSLYGVASLLNNAEAMK